MAIKFEKIQPGMTLYDRHRDRMGRTSLRALGEWPVRVISVDRETRTAVVSWNSNRPNTWYARRLEKLFNWSMDDPEIAEVRKSGIFGHVISVRKKKRTKAAP